MKWLSVEGPLHETWPPSATRELLGDLAIVDGRVQLHKAPSAHVLDIVCGFRTKGLPPPLGTR